MGKESNERLEAADIDYVAEAAETQQCQSLQGLKWELLNPSLQIINLFAVMYS